MALIDGSQIQPLTIKSVDLSYDDTLVTPPLGSDNVQGAIDALKQGSGGTPLTGDVTTVGSVATVVGLQAHALADTAPIDHAVPIYSATADEYAVRQLSLDDIAPAFGITSFSGGSVVEIGFSVTNPSFSASYTSEPSSAQITNTASIDSPLVMSPPYTLATVVGTFIRNSQTSVDFLLTAVGATTKTASQSINFLPRMFAGVGGAGALSATSSGTSANLVGATGTLYDQGLSGNPVGSTYGPLSPSGQKIYLLLTGSSHTFKDENGFLFSMLTPRVVSFVNQYGATVTMYLYESTNTLSTTFTITVEN